MCGRFVQARSTGDLTALFSVTEPATDLPEPSWNVAPTQTVAVVIDSAKGEGEQVRRLEPARWSLTPSWSKTIKTKFPTFNARSEDIATKASWKGPLKAHRAIVPVDGYYEWQTDDNGIKTPTYIHGADGETLALAGLYSWWPDHALDENDPNYWTLTATILTSSAIDELLGIHDRNPVPLPEHLWGQWLDPTVIGDQALVDEAVRSALPVAQTLQFHTVPPLRGDGPQLIEAT
ncbi:SOS response-associated peptidase [Agreia sp. COWG]|uniref:SOS response-associated peptidase n=1 Tax=Agreia sp. COWG TaxID=2773266 RepID=UPI0019264988|nr:SOS response-associated peptidase [Agreia sp. COWG]CAD6015805.1 Putative SOS response-associated peptidase [Agreia sp. COWG]